MGGKKLISVIIPIYNAEIHLNDLLNSLLNQTLENQYYEVLLIDNNSNDNTESIIKKFISKIETSNIKYKSFDQKQGSYATRNFGIKNSQGEILAFTDADCIPQANWLKNIYKFYNKSETRKSILAGNIEIFISDENNLWETYDKLTHLNNKKYAANNRGATANLVVPRKAFREIGFFKEVFSGGDTAWTNKAVREGYSIEYKADVKVLHPARDNYFEIKSKMYRMGYGRGKKAKINNQSGLYLLLLYFLRIFYIKTNIRHTRKLARKFSIWKLILFNFLFFGLRIFQLKGVYNGYNSETNERQGEK